MKKKETLVIITEADALIKIINMAVDKAFEKHYKKLSNESNNRKVT
jgi:hypothetical protein